VGSVADHANLLGFYGVLGGFLVCFYFEKTSNEKARRQVLSMICGIDIGLSGGIAFFEHGRLGSVFDMPAKPTPWDKGRCVDSLALHDILTRHRPVCAFVERVHAMPKQGVSSMFTFGMSFQAVLSVLEVMGIQYQLVEPKAWQKNFGVVGKTKEGKKSADIVKGFYPCAPIYGTKGGIKDGRCDAILIALYGGSKLLKQ